MRHRAGFFDMRAKWVLVSLLQRLFERLRAMARGQRTGTVQFGAQVLDNLLAPGISNFNEAVIPDLADACPQADYWISNLFLNSLFGARYNDEWKQAAITFIFRTQTALRAYGRARIMTLRCVGSFQPGRPDNRAYFEAVSEWETVLLNIQIALDVFLRVMDSTAVVTDDAVRIRRAANRIKHFAEDIEQGVNPANFTLPMWLERDRLVTRTAHVTFDEIAENLREMGSAADILQNPSSPATP